MNTLKLSLLSLALTFATTGYCEEISGIAKYIGSSFNATIKLVELDAKGKITESKKLCKNESAMKIGRLSGMTITAKGEWKEPKKRCFVASEFRVTKMSSGRSPLVGILTRDKGSFVVQDESGKTKSLTRVSKGLRDLLGKKVIIDVKPMNSPVGKEVSFKVVSYAEFP